MGKLAESHRHAHPADAKRELMRLKGERRKLWRNLEKLDKLLAELTPPSNAKKFRQKANLDRWFDELSRGLDQLPPLPTDFSRADLYDDHD